MTDQPFLELVYAILLTGIGLDGEHRLNGAGGAQAVPGHRLGAMTHRD